MRSGIVSKVLVVSILLLMPAAGLAATKARKESFVSGKKKHSYYLFVPESVKNPSPLLILFHGSGHDGMSLVEKWQDLAEKEQIILAGLNSLDPSRWNTVEDGPEVVRDMVEQIKQSNPVDPKRVYLFGHSGGAVYAILLSMMQSEYFAAAAVHAGSLRSEDELKVIEKVRRNIPLAIWVGTQDPYFSLASVRATRDAIAARGSPVAVTEMPGHDHWYYDLAPRINEGAWQFLKKYSLTNEPRFQSYVETGGNTGVEKAVAGLNQTLQEINALKTKVNALVASASEREIASNAKDLETDRAEINQRAKEEVEFLKEAAALSRSIADKATQAETTKVEEKYRRYFDLIAQHNRKYAEMLDVIREQAELLLGTESNQTIASKRLEAQKRILALRQEADYLYQQAEKLVH